MSNIWQLQLTMAFNGLIGFGINNLFIILIVIIKVPAIFQNKYSAQK